MDLHLRDYNFSNWVQGETHLDWIHYWKTKKQRYEEMLRLYQTAMSQIDKYEVCIYFPDMDKMDLEFFCFNMCAQMDSCDSEIDSILQEQHNNFEQHIKERVADKHHKEWLQQPIKSDGLPPGKQANLFE